VTDLDTVAQTDAGAVLAPRRERLDAIDRQILERVVRRMEICLDIARLMSDPKVAQNFRASAAQYFARASELEHQDEEIDASPKSARR